MRQMLGSDAFKVFEFRGHAVHVTLTYGIVVLLILSTAPNIAGAIWLFSITFSVLWHELGHALAYERYSCGPSDIIIHGFGGVTMNPYGSSLTRGPRMFVSAAGPLLGLALSGILIGVSVSLQNGLGVTLHGGFPGPAPASSPAMLLLNLMIYVNLFWSVFNLLPIYPMDGGHVFLSFLSKYNRNPMRVTAILSMALLVPLVVLAFHYKFAIMAIILALMAFQNFQLLQQTRPTPRGFYDKLNGD